jgi:hypothetical protein
LWTLGSGISGRHAYRGSAVLSPVLSRLLARLGPERSLGQSYEELTRGTLSERLLGRPNNSVCALIVSQLRRAPTVAAHRAAIVQLYDKAMNIVRDPQPLARYPLVVSDPASFERAMAHRGWNVSGRWFRTPIHPVRDVPKRLAYSPDAGPRGEQLAAHVVNLPTHTMVDDSDARELIAIAFGAGAQPIITVTDAPDSVIDTRSSSSTTVKP